MRNLKAAIEARRTIALDRFIYGLGIRHVGETTPLVLARGYGDAEAFLAAMDKVAAGDAEAIAELDALDQIGDAVIEAAGAYFPRPTTAASSRPCASSSPSWTAEQPQAPTPLWPARPWSLLARSSG